jgi:DNA-binding NarL/FixJ family response regulator
MCAESLDEPSVLDSVQAGACGYLTKDTLTPETLAAGVRAVHSGAGVLPPDVLGSLLRTLAEVSRDVLEPRGLSRTSLTMRERNVLRLVADGLPTREVAQRLSSSERIIDAADTSGALMKNTASTGVTGAATAVINTLAS